MMMGMTMMINMRAVFGACLYAGNFVPREWEIPLWELENDYFLHNYHVQQGGLRSQRLYNLSIQGNDDDDDEDEEDRRREGQREVCIVEPFTSIHVLYT